MDNTKVGLFGIGLDTYWPQFEGLLERLQGYQNQIAEKIQGFGAEVVNVGLVDSPEKASSYFTQKRGYRRSIFICFHLRIILYSFASGSKATMPNNHLEHSTRSSY